MVCVQRTISPAGECPYTSICAGVYEMKIG